MSDISIVNGYVCRDCTDVAFAKRNIDPQNPDGDPAKQAKLDATSPQAAATAAASTVSSGLLDRYA